MIQLEYDIPTAGMKVSFIVKDRAMSAPIGPETFTDLVHSDGKARCPQNATNMELLRQLATFATDGD